MVSIINPILVALDDGWTFTILGSLCILTSPLLYVEIRWGPVWRERRRQKQLHRRSTADDASAPSRGTDYRIIHITRQALQPLVNSHDGVPVNATSLSVIHPVS